MLVFLGILSGIFVGQFLGDYLGEFGWFAGYIIGYFLCIFVADVFYYGNKVQGFFRRQRAGILEFLFAIVAGILAAKLIYDSFWVFLGGLYVGVLIAQWFAKQLQWDEDSSTDAMAGRTSYLAVLYNFLNVDGAVHPNSQKEFDALVQKVFEEEGYGEGFFTILDEYIQSTKQNYTIADLLNLLADTPSDGTLAFLVDYLRCAYSAPSVSPNQKQLALGIYNRYQTYYDLLTIYDRSFETSEAPDEREQALRTLKVCANATYDEIQSAYREQIRQYHPDTLHGASLGIQEMARQKTIELNRAYEILMGRGTASYPQETALLFLDGNGQPFVPSSYETFVCRCHLCEKKSRIPQGRDLSLARCHRCHALLGRK